MAGTDRSWMFIRNRIDSEAYNLGVKAFIDYARPKADAHNRIKCPCKKCNNRIFMTMHMVEAHLFVHGIDPSYTKWVFHGEINIQQSEETHINNPVVTDDESDDESDDDEEGIDEMDELLDDVRRGTFVDDSVPSSSHNVGSNNGMESTKFETLLKDAQLPLYPGCEKLSKLNFIVKLLHIKTMCRLSNKALDMLLELFKEALPAGETLPTTNYAAKVMLRDLGIGYNCIHACKNDCILFYKEHENLEDCPECGESRWKKKQANGRKIPHKILRHFPLKPRLQRLFMSKFNAQNMRWHKEKRVQDANIMSHPADSKAWEEFDKNHEWFARDSRNVRLGLASDGFNPFGNMSNSYSMWPVVLMPYNFPPWMCLKESLFMMSLLIPGPRSPGNDIDVYLQPLIDELLELWNNGVMTYDAFANENFMLHAALLWTINDFPAYANLSGWSTKGKLACPTCNKETCSLYLKHGRKVCYMAHRRWLPQGHSWRKKTTIFDGKQEHRLPPVELSGNDVLEELSNIRDVKFGKPPNVRKRKRTDIEYNWTKKSIFFDLPYWHTLILRHNLDVMHIEKNICDNVLGTLMNIEGKTKDTFKSRLDLQELGLKKELHLKPHGNSYKVPKAGFTLDKTERKSLCQWLKLVKFPDGYASNISRCVNVDDCKILGMKSHDCHVFLQRLLPVAIRGFLRNDVNDALTDLGLFFKELCSKTLQKDVLDRLEKEIAIILCKFERIFPPSFFDVMVHLAIHLPREASIAGPVQYRWMYPIERYLHTLKQYVKNKARPEGSIAEAYITNECLTFCSKYLHGIETRFNRDDRNHDGVQDARVETFSVFAQSVRPLGASMFTEMGRDDLAKVRWYVLNNCEEIDHYRNEHIDEMYKLYPATYEKKHTEGFTKWFQERMMSLRSRNSPEATDQLYSLACGPDHRVSKYTGCISNGVRYHTEERERNRTTQNSGVVVQGVHKSKDVDFYGVLTSIIELKYCMGYRVYVFKCDWWDIENKRLGIRSDKNFTSVNLSRKWYKDDPFVLAMQAQQVFYLQDTKLGSLWHVVQKIKPRNVYDVPEASEEDNEAHRNEMSTSEDAYQENMTSETRNDHGDIFIDGDEDMEDAVDGIDMSPLNIPDADPDFVDASTVEECIGECEKQANTLSDDEEIMDDIDVEEQQQLVSNDSEDEDDEDEY